MKKKIGDLTLRELKKIYDKKCDPIFNNSFFCDESLCEECAAFQTSWIDLDEEIEVQE